MTKYLHISNFRSLDEVKRYLPSGWDAHLVHDDFILATGQERAGWTVDGYILPRLASGLIVAKEIV
jgi:hypothetical protein